MRKLYVGTTNPGKIKELASLLFHHQFEEIIPISDNVQETGITFKENATIKAMHYSSLTNEHVLVEDSGLSVPYLNGLPGVYSSRFHEISIDHNNVVTNVPYEDFTTFKLNHDKLNNQLLIDIMKDVPMNLRGAYFSIYLIFVKEGKILYEKEFKRHGYISTEIRGENGFGYDPIFIGNDTENKTFAELDEYRKNFRSHRKMAIKEFDNTFLTSYIKEMYEKNC